MRANSMRCVVCGYKATQSQEAKVHHGWTKHDLWQCLDCNQWVGHGDGHACRLKGTREVRRIIALEGLLRRAKHYLENNVAAGLNAKEYDAIIAEAGELLDCG